MRAVLSGRAAVALLNEGDVWQSMTYEAPEQLTPCHAAEAHVLLRNTHDLIWLDDVSIDEVRDRLADVVDTTEALDCVLYLLDGSLQPATRDAVALEFEELAIWPEIVEQVESVLLACPLPASADIAGAIDACTRTESHAAAELFRQWQSLQPTVSAIFDAWLQIPIGRFGNTEQRIVAHGHFIKHDIFPVIARTELEVSRLTTVQFGLASNTKLKLDVPGAVGIINDWLRLLRGSQREFEFAEVADDLDAASAEKDEGTPKKRRSIDRGRVKANVDGTKRLIVEALRANHTDRAMALTQELISYQLGNDGKRLIGKSLCDLAMEAQQLGNDTLQLWFTTEAVQRVPDDGWAWAQHGKSLLNVGQFSKADAAFQNSIDFGDGETTPVAKNGRAEILKAQGDLKGALAAFDSVIQSHPENVVAKNGRAEVLKAQGDLKGALAAFDSVIQSHPENVVAKTGRAEVLKAKDDLHEALAAFDCIIADHPENLVAKTGRISVLVLMGRWDAALADVPTTEPQSHDDWIDYHIRGMIAFRRNDLAEAERILERGTLSCPFLDSRSYFENALAIVRLKQGRLQDAQRLAEKNLAGRWHGPMTALLVHIKGRMGELESARESFGALPVPPNALIAETFEELERRYVWNQPPQHDEDWLIGREIQYLLSC
ncbi:MAG TPA: tetratricopeptide repeat protein [Planctomycetaceae bacterium]|nr:tetratricopeptide repeat protein [Planctomycetaceae bacterium]